MTRSMHTVKYAQANFKRYQLLAVIFALLTVVASLLAALSGIRVKTLQESRAEAIASSTEDQKQRAETATNTTKVLKKLLATSREQLAAEKRNVKNLIGKIAELERQLTATQAKLQAQQQEQKGMIPPEDPTPEPMEALPEPTPDAPPPPADSPVPAPSEDDEMGDVPTDPVE